MGLLSLGSIDPSIWVSVHDFTRLRQIIRADAELVDAFALQRAPAFPDAAGGGFPGPRNVLRGANSLGVQANCLCLSGLGIETRIFSD